ncbi:MAG: hypothetical protein COA78_07030 [Blastopirellula sp.]|nr:MAG: hypothetical protein COA78_07030 [Blastopirellula sp.]
MAAPVRNLYINSANVFEYQCFFSDEDIAALPAIDAADKYITTAAVNFNLYGDEERTIPIIANLALPFVTGTDGLYRATESVNNLILDKTFYYWVLTVTFGGEVKESSGKVKAKPDTGKDEI